MENKPNILIVDDEKEIVNALTRLFRKEFKVHATTSPVDAVDLIKQTEFSAIISDMRMPIMSGAELLTQAFKVAPQTPRILLTGYSDINSTAQAINQGHISNYISKPWDNQELRQVVLQATEQHQLYVAAQCYESQTSQNEKKLKSKTAQLAKQHNEDKKQLNNLQHTLQRKTQNTRDLFHDVVDMINVISKETIGDNDGHIKRVAMHCRLLAKCLTLSSLQISQCYLAGLMHEIGKVALSNELKNKKEFELDRNELQLKQAHAINGANILSTVPSLQPISTILRHQYEWVDGTGMPDHLSSADIPIESKILSIVNDYDNLLLGNKSQHPLSVQQAQIHMYDLAGKTYDKDMLTKYFKLLANRPHQSQQNFDLCISVNQLEVGMTLARDLMGKNEGVLLTEGTTVTQATIETLRRYEREWDRVMNVFIK